MDEEILQEFCSETKVLLGELVTLLEDLELNPEKFSSLEIFGQKVDRIMGAAKSLDLTQMGLISEYCKTLSYKSAQSKNKELVIIVVAFLFEAVEKLNEMIGTLSIKKSAELNPSAIKTILARLEFIGGRLSHIQRSSIAINDKDLFDLTEDFNKLSKSK